LDVAAIFAIRDVVAIEAILGVLDVIPRAILGTGISTSHH